MEDALVRSRRTGCRYFFPCLNPCFNGRCTRTFLRRRIQIPKRVLILVLMEDALVQINKNHKFDVMFVLILVLMEDALVQVIKI